MSNPVTPPAHAAPAAAAPAALPLSLHGRQALVTGASSGLGLHFARVLARAGAAVALTARRIDKLEAAAADIVREGGRATAIAMDVADPGSVNAGFAAATAALGPIDIVVANAGVPSSSYFTAIPEDEWSRVMEINVAGVFRVGQTAARLMQVEGRGGSIINIASILSFGVLKAVAPYATSKAAVVQLTKAMALELARDSIRVNAIAPGYVTTEMTEDYLASEAGQKLARRVPLGRIGALSDFDGPLLLLASDAGRYMTGSVITVDGGTLLAMG